ncbi:MAG TPA: bifunctional hydroxymethylpyrimidine kinase/phosphomethylpyrimidine kinase [Flavobacteriaceae bacterium]|nr:bifunctional hydroxymethylpyrimidine kinase/phosphomethylpyrimidine kinase [Flavobacteriaceae bacterium]
MKELNQHIKLPKRVLTIAGSASGGSAGIQADLKTFHEIGVYGMSVITAIVGRHPETGTNVHPNTITSIEAQFATVLEQTGIDSLKTGMLFSKEIIQVVADLLNEVKHAAIVVDPVMVGKHNSILLREDAMDALVNKIVPQATIITPNMEEASILLDNRPIKTLDDCKQAAIDLHRDGQKQVLVKGGRLKGPAIDILYDGNTMYCLEAPRIPTQNTSGAGCSYSAAIAAYTAKGFSIFDAVKAAKQFITTAIAYSYSFTDKPGPVNQLANRHEKAIYEVSTYKD